MMAIPDEIKQIKRPKCTEIRLISNHYYVYKYTCVYDKEKKKNKKKTLGCIGKITIDDGFIPNRAYKPAISVRCKEFGGYALINSLCNDLKEAIKASFPNEYNRIFIIAMIRLLYGCEFSKINDYYNTCAVSDDYDVPLSKNTVIAFLSYLGNHREKITDFMKGYVSGSSQLLINSFDFFTSSNIENAKKDKSHPQIALLYTFDKTNHFPGYYRVLPGNIVYQVSFKNLIMETNANECLFIGDKGFYSQRNIKLLKSEKIDYIIPLKSNLKILEEYLENRDDDKTYDGFFMYHGRVIWYKKHKKNDETFIYQYLDIESKTQLEKSYMKNIVEEKENYTIEHFHEKRKNMGVFHFISNLNQSCQELYLTYKERSEIEIMFEAIKNTVGISEVNLSNQIEVEGWAFINHLTMMMSYKILSLLKDNELSNQYSVMEVINTFKAIQKVTLENKKDTISELTKKEQDLVNKLKLDPALFTNNYL